MADIKTQSFAIDSSMDLPADEFNSISASSEPFRNANPADVLTFDMGFIDPVTQVVSTIRHLSGTVDEWLLRVTPTSLITTLRGRDRMAFMLDAPYNMMYFRTQPDKATTDALIEKGTAYKVGIFTASSIAADAASAAASAFSSTLFLHWECRDYILQDNFEATGSALDTIRKLIEPWNIVPMFKTNMFVQGNTLIIKQRAGTFTADYSYSVKDARISNLEIRKRRRPPIGKVTLEGMLQTRGLEITGALAHQPSPDPDKDTGGKTFSPTEEIVKREQKSFDKKTGELTSHIITEERYNVPPRILKKASEKHYTMEEGLTSVGGTGGTGTRPDGSARGSAPAAAKTLVYKKEEIKENTYGEITYDANGPTSEPKILRQSNVTWGVSLDDPTRVWRILREEVINYTYDFDDFLDMVETNIYEWVPPEKGVAGPAPMPKKQRIIKTYRVPEYLKVEQTVTTYGIDDNGVEYISNTDTQLSDGIRPGIKRPPPPVTTEEKNVAADPYSPGGQITKSPITLTYTISALPYAVPFSYSNPNLTMDDLLFILNQLIQASGIFEYEMNMNYVSMPWLRKGNVLQLTGLVAEDGSTPISLSPALIVDQTISWNEASNTPDVSARIRSMFWRNT